MPIQNTSTRHKNIIWSVMAWLNLRRLRYFRAICEAGSISEAARRIAVPQPALSYHLRELEADFGAALLLRSSKGVVPTDGGRLLLDHATIITAQVGRAEAELRALRSRRPADPRALRISAIPSLARDLTPRLLLHPTGLANISGVYVSEANTREAREMLSAGETDFAVLIADETTPEARYLAPENMLLCMAAGHPDLEFRPITLAEALAEPLMLPAKGKPVRLLVERMARTINAQVSVSYEIDGPHPRKQATIAGLGRTVLPWIAIHEEVKAGLIRYREVVDPPLARHVGLEWREGLDSEVTTTIHRLLKTLLGTMLR